MILRLTVRIAGVFGGVTARWYTIVQTVIESISFSMKMLKSKVSSKMMIEEVHRLVPDVVGTSVCTVHRLDLGVVAELGNRVHDQ